jgi:parallel beta-helix repeat protein
MLRTRLRQLVARERRRIPRGRRALALEHLEERNLLSTVWMVDDDRIQCPTADFTSIGAAVAAAHRGDVIDVCPGTYNESVVVNKSLTFVGPDHGREQDARTDFTSAFDPTQSAIVQPPQGSSAFDVEAGGVVINGFTLTGATGAPGVNLSRHHSGYAVLSDVIAGNTVGVYLNSNGNYPAVIRDNAFLHNNVDGPASGTGVYSDQGVAHARIVDNLFRGEQNAAVMFLGGAALDSAQFDLTVCGNHLVNDSRILFINAREVRVLGNVSLGSDASGIVFAGGVHDALVAGNVLRDGAFSGINLRTDSDHFPVTEPNHDIVLYHNFVRHFGHYGMRIRDGAYNVSVLNNTVLGNGTASDPTSEDPAFGAGISLENVHAILVDGNVTSYNHLDGIWLQNTDHSILHANTSNHNGRDGIRVDANSNHNRITDNILLHNAEFDARDDSTGDGTAGTANYWNDNLGETQSPDGLLGHHST